MFGIFKRKNYKNTIANKIQSILDQGESNLHINIFVEDQILFQIAPSKYYVNKGFNEVGFIELHFFNMNKTYTIKNQDKFHQLFENGSITYFEEPKGIHNYIAEIGNEPNEIERVIKNRIEHYYKGIEYNRISIEYLGY